MGAAGSVGKRYEAEAGPSAPAALGSPRGPWHLPRGGCVVSIADFDPKTIQWPESWGVPLTLEKSMAIVVLSDDGGDRAFGHYLAQPERRGFFLKHLTTKLNAASAETPKHPGLRVPGPASAGSESRLSGQTHRCARQPSPVASSPSTLVSTRVTDDSPVSLVSGQMTEMGDLHVDVMANQSRPASCPIRVMQTSDQGKRTAAKGGPRSQGAENSGTAAEKTGDVCEQIDCRTEVLRAARHIGLDMDGDAVLLWLAESYAEAELPDGWVMFEDDAGQSAYYHDRKKFVARQHPMLAKYKSYAARMRQTYRRMSDKAALHGPRKIRAHLALVLNEALNRCNRELPAITPELLERAALLLAVDTSSEFKLSTKAAGLSMARSIICGNLGSLRGEDGHGCFRRGSV